MGADALDRQAVNAGELNHTGLKDRWPYGLDADGEPSPPWTAAITCS
ncbi:hypothetical protein [Streptomyces mirabilis]